jgi:hypothetical protein
VAVAAGQTEVVGMVPVAEEDSASGVVQDDARGGALGRGDVQIAEYGHQAQNRRNGGDGIIPFAHSALPWSDVVAPYSFTQTLGQGLIQQSGPLATLVPRKNGESEFAHKLIILMYYAACRKSVMKILREIQTDLATCLPQMLRDSSRLIHAKREGQWCFFLPTPANMWAYRGNF